MWQWFNNVDQNLFFFLNGLHASWLDPVMLFLSNKFVWLPLYLYLIYRLFVHFKKNTVWLVILILLTVGAADYTTSGILKPTVQRLRPCKDAQINRDIHTVGNCGGQYGFASSHAANTFAAATFIFLLLGRKEVITSRLLIVWATLVAYSRVYLGVHYPGDIIVGAAIGMLLAHLVKYLGFRHIKTLQHIKPT